MDLQSIDGIGPSTEESLNEIGVNTIEELSNASVEDISSCGMSESRARDVKQKAKENTITIQSIDDVEDEYKSNKTITTGIDKLDEVIEGGWEQESVVSIYGDSSTGKTQLCMQALVEGVRQTELDAIYIETEKNRFRPERIENICKGYDDVDYEEVKSKIHRVKAYDLEKQLSSYGKVSNTFPEVSIVVVDSLVAQFRLSDEFTDRSDYGKRGVEMSRHLKGMERMAEQLSCPVLFTNQIYEVPDSNGPYQSIQVRQYGGKKIQYVAQYSVFMEEGRGDKFKCNVEAHPSSGDSVIEIEIKEDGIDCIDSDL